MKNIFTVCMLLMMFTGASANPGTESFAYRSPAEIATMLQSIAKDNRSAAELHELGMTPGDRPVLLLELGKKSGQVPAVLVVANMEGNCPLASEGALMLCQLLAGEWQKELEARTWYVVPLGNPDGYAHFFQKPLRECFRNARPFNDDNDEATDEDGPEDLNGDGLITMMRQIHPEGGWIKVEGNPVLLKGADESRGETGIYRLFTEGVDNDGDGEYNEDGPGGANPGHNFPHEFQHYTRTDGPWAASEAESRAVLKFAFDHPEIAMVLTLGRTNSLKAVPESSKRAEASQSKYKIPERWARRMGLDPEQEYPLKELLEMGRDFTGYKDLTEDMLLQWLDAGAAVNPDRDDLPYWKEISDRYNKFIKEAKLDGKRLDPPGFPPGSVEEWAYYQYGVPSFSMDFWTVPVQEKKKETKEQGMLTPDSIENMSNEEFINLGTERIGEVLKESGAPAQYTAEMVIKGLEGGMMDTKKMAEMMRKMKKKEETGGADEREQALYDFNPEAFIAWQPFEHPTLGNVEIGGKIPYADLAPPAQGIEELLEKQLPFVRELVKLLPEIRIDTFDVQKVSQGVWSIEAWVKNDGFLPYPTHQGQRCQRPTPVAAILNGESVSFLEGRERVVLKLLEGSGGVQKAKWLIAAKDGSRITIGAHTYIAGMDERTITLKGGGGQ